MHSAMSNKQKVYLRISILVAVLGQLLTHFYRPYIYRNNIFDFGFADTIGSLASVICSCFIFWTFKTYSNKEKDKQIMLSVATYSIIWEPMGLIGLHGTFDWKDIVAVLISGLITYRIKEFIEKQMPENKIEVTTDNYNYDNMR